jgi:biotin operon repressor
MKTNEMQLLLAFLSHDPAEAASLEQLSTELLCSPKDVEKRIETARLAGHLIVENAQGYFIAPDYATFAQWRADRVIPVLVGHLDVLGAMGRAARRQFRVADAPDELLLTG